MVTQHIPTVWPILVPRGRGPFGQPQESTSQHQKSAIHGLIVKSDKSDWLTIIEKIFCACSKIGTGQRSRFLVLTKRIAASGEENGFSQNLYACSLYYL